VVNQVVVPNFTRMSSVGPEMSDETLAELLEAFQAELEDIKDGQDSPLLRRMGRKEAKTFLTDNIMWIGYELMRRGKIEGHHT